MTGEGALWSAGNLDEGMTLNMTQQSMTSERWWRSILVNYESGEDLVSAIWSLVQLKRAPDVFIVVDNASEDDSLHLAQIDFNLL